MVAALNSQETDQAIENRSDQLPCHSLKRFQEAVAPAAETRMR
jgi:hypothetical protein